MVTVQQRINTIKGYNTYLGLDVYAKEIIDAVLVTITSYRKYNNKAHEYVEFWIVPNANLSSSNYIQMSAYPINITVTQNLRKTYVAFSRRWRRGW